MNRLFALSLVILLLASCTQDAYEKGEGDYSNMQADFVEAHTNAGMLIDYVVTDDDMRLSLQSLLRPSWTAVADTTYRAVLYYNKVGNGSSVEAVSIGRVSVASVLPVDSLKEDMKTDPVRLESVWLSKNRRYLNVGLYVKTGASADKVVQRLGVVADSLEHHADGKLTLHVQLYHDQGDVPQYYSQRTYFSLATQQLNADSVTLRLNTYDGPVVKSLSIR